MREVFHLARLAIALVVAGAAFACATTAPAAEKTTDIQAVQTRILELQRKAAVAEVEIARLRQQVANLEARLASAPAPPAPTPGRAAAPVPEPPPAPVQTVEVQDLAEPAAPPAAEVAPPAGEATPSPVSAEGQAAYDEAYALFHQGRYLDAESSFQRFLQTYPQTDLTDNAFYWIGESRFARGDIRGALAAFRQTVESYPRGNKVPDALLKAGQCLQALGDPDGARASFEEIVKRFPDSAAAVVAQERLQAMP